MKKFFVTAAMVMSMGCAFAQSEATPNDTVKTDTTKACPAKSLVAMTDTVATDSAKALVAMADTVVTDSAKAFVAMADTVTTDSTKALVAMADTVVTDSAKAQPAALVAMIEENDTTTQTKETKTTPATCDKKAGEKAIKAFNTMRKITA